MTPSENPTGMSIADIPAGEGGRFHERAVEVTASRWWTNGDHPEDRIGQDETDPTGDTYQRLEGAVVRFYQNPDIPGDRACSHCGREAHRHGWIDAVDDGYIVCPGDWIVTGTDGDYYPMKPYIFERTYKPVVE